MVAAIDIMREMSKRGRNQFLLLTPAGSMIGILHPDDANTEDAIVLHDVIVKTVSWPFTIIDELIVNPGMIVAIQGLDEETAKHLRSSLLSQA